jgi:hypothetical protein
MGILLTTTVTTMLEVFCVGVLVGLASGLTLGWRLGKKGAN